MLTGRTLGGRYKLLGLLGSGGMGAVYEAEQIDLRRRVAVKVLHGAGDRAAASEDFLRFKQEALAAAGLGHPNIVQIIDYEEGDENDPPFLVMELLRGTSLASLVKREKRIEPARAVAIMVQVLSALAAAHEARIVHRDVKPENVFVCNTSPLYELVKVLDFGLARPLDDQKRLARTQVGYVMGTPAYMAPEQARGAAADVRMDLFAVGVSLYYALAGRRPFEGPTTSALLEAIRRQPPIPLDSLRPELDLGLVRVVEKSLSKEPDQRFATAGDFIDALAPHWPRGAIGSQDALVPPKPADQPTKPDRPAPAIAGGQAPTAAARPARAQDTDRDARQATTKLVFTALSPRIAPGMVSLARFARDGSSALAIGPAGLARLVIDPSAPERASWGARTLPRGWATNAVRGFAFGPQGEALLFAEGDRAEFRVAGGEYEPFMHNAEIVVSAAHVDDIATVALAGTDKRTGDAVVVERTREDRRAYPIAARRSLFDVTRTGGTLVACGEKGSFCLIARGKVHARVLGHSALRALAPFGADGVVAVGDDGAFLRLDHATAEALASATPTRVGADDLFLACADVEREIACGIGRRNNAYLSFADAPVEAVPLDVRSAIRAAWLGGGKLRLLLDDASVLEAPVSGGP